MKSIISFWVHNNARIGQTISWFVAVSASRGWISLQTLADISAGLAIWGIGSWVQGAKNNFRPPTAK